MFQMNLTAQKLVSKEKDERATDADHLQTPCW